MFVSVNVPHQPDWLFHRSALTLDFIVGVDGPTDTVSDLQFSIDLDPAVQN